MLSAILLSAFLFLACQPNVEAQSSSTVVSVPLTFHGYSLILRDANNSFYVYDGADGAAPDPSSAGQANLVAQISGQRDGWSYWSAVIMWAAKLPMDVHVKGTVNMRAYISSTFKLSGFFSGGGYGMGLVDIDENNNEVKEFITEAPYTIGGNPFTATPTQYSLSTNVDYVFKKGHSIGFAVGLGATTQGFTATVYFGSSDRNSGATLPILDTTESHAFTADYNGASHTIAVESNSVIANYQYDQAKTSIKFTAQGISYTTGSCKVAIPKTLVAAPFTVTSSGQTITPTATENATHTQLAFSHTRTVNPIQIAGTAPPPQTTATPTPTTATPSATPDQTTTTPTAPTATSTAQATVEPTATPAIQEYLALIILPLMVLTGLLALALKKKINN